MLKIGMLGMGRMGNVHAPNLRANPRVKLAAAFDPDRGHAEAARDAFGMELTSSAEELIAHPDLDAVFIASPTFCHAAAVQSAVAAGKAVFVEKPVCRTTQECNELSKLAAKADARVTVGFVRRYLPAQQAFHEVVANGELGTIRHASVELTLGTFKRLKGDWFADFALSGGVTLDMLSHHLDLLVWSFGLPETVYCQGNLLARTDLPLPQDFASITARFPKGIVCNIVCAWNRMGRSVNAMDVYGDDACASYVWARNELTVQRMGETEPKTLACPCAENPYKLETDAWVDAILAGRTPEVTLNDGIRAFRFADAALASAATGTVQTLC